MDKCGGKEGRKESKRRKIRYIINHREQVIYQYIYIKTLPHPDTSIQTSSNSRHYSNVYLSIFLSNNLLIYLSIYPSIYLLIYLSINLSVSIPSPY